MDDEQLCECGCFLGFSEDGKNPVGFNCCNAECWCHRYLPVMDEASVLIAPRQP